MNPTPYLSEATYMCIFPIVILFLLIICDVIRNIHNSTPLRSEIILCTSSCRMLPKHYRGISLFLSLLYIAMASGTEVLKGTAFSENYHQTYGIILRIALPLMGFLCCYLLLCRLFHGYSFPTTKGFAKIGNTPVYLVMIPITLLTVFFILGSYPGFMSSDTAYSWYSVMHGSYSDWHTVTYLYVLKFAEKIFGTPYAIVIFQAALWILINQYALFLLEKYAPYRYVDCVWFVMQLFLFNSYRALCNVEKDTIWNMAVFLFCLCIFDLVKTAQLKWYLFPLLFGSAWITATIRHMGDVIIIITFAFLCICFKRKHMLQRFRCTLAGLISVIVIKFILVNILGFTILYATPNPAYVKYSIPMTMAGAVASEEDLPQEDIQVLEQIMPLEKWQECYDKYYADTLSRDWGPIGEDIYKLNDPKLGKDLLLLNLKFVLRYPITYLTAYFDITSILWEMGTPADGYEWIPISLYSTAVDQYPELNGLQTHYNVITTKLEKISELTDKIPVYSSICWRGGFALFTLITAFFLLIRKKHLPDTIILLPAILLAGVLFLANPSQDPRYINSWQMLSSFLLIYSFFLPLKQE